MLWMYQRVFFGRVTQPANASLPDLSLRERTALWPMAAAAVVMGVVPLIWLAAINPAAQSLLANFAQLTGMGR
jgi:NADH-quinone oxidoreductase subunit M